MRCAITLYVEKVADVVLTCHIMLYCMMILGRSAEKLKVVETYLRANAMFRNYEDPNEDPVFSEVRQI